MSLEETDPFHNLGENIMGALDSDVGFAVKKGHLMPLVSYFP